AADDGVVHAHVGAEVADGTVAGAQTHTDLQRLGDALAAPLLAQHLHVLAHGDGHGYGRFGVLLGAAADRIDADRHRAVTDALLVVAAVLHSVASDLF